MLVEDTGVQTRESKVLGLLVEPNFGLEVKGEIIVDALIALVEFQHFIFIHAG